MKKSTKIITISIVATLLITSLILIWVVLLPKLKEEDTKKNLEESLRTLAVDSYENRLKSVMPDFLEKNGYMKITLDYLQGLGIDIKDFEDNKCDYYETYVELLQDEGDDTYRTEVKLTCESLKET